MLVAVLGRHAGVALGSSDVFVNVAGGVRIDEPAADLAVAVAVVSAHRGVTLRSGFGCFGEIGLTGRLRAVGQTERRQAEAAKLGIPEAVAAGWDGGRAGNEASAGRNGAAALQAVFA